MNLTSLITAICVGILLPALHCQASDETDVARGDSHSNRAFDIGVGVGVASFSDDFVLIDDSSMAYKIFAGYKLNEFLSFEASLLRFEGVYEFNPFDVLTQDGVADRHGVNGAAVLTLPISDRFQLNGRAGFLRWSLDATDPALDDSGTDVSVGFGVQIKLNKALSVRVDYDAYQFGGVDTHVGTLALGYRF